MAIIAGPRGTGNITQAQRKPDIGDRVLLLQPDAAPLTVLSKMTRRKPTVNPEFKWAEDDLDVRFSSISNAGGYAAGATSLVVANGTYFAEHDLVRVTRTGEIFRVTAVATNTLTVVRGVGNAGTGTTLNDADELLILGSAQPEGDTSKPARSSTTTFVTNYTQIFRTPWELTETWDKSDTFFTQSDWDYQRGKKGIEHLKSIEEAFLYGKADENTSGSQPRRTTGGALSRITTNVTAAGGVLSETSFWGALRGAFRYGSQSKWLFASMLVADVLNGYARSKVLVNDSGNGSYGLNVRNFQSPHGNLKLVTHFLLEGSTYGGYALVIDQANVAYRYLANSRGSRDTHVRENIQAPDADTRKDEWLTECGLELGQERTHALITGITG